MPRHLTLFVTVNVLIAAVMFYLVWSGLMLQKDVYLVALFCVVAINALIFFLLRRPAA